MASHKGLSVTKRGEVSNMKRSDESASPDVPTSPSAHAQLAATSRETGAQLLAATTRLQAQAADPAASVWVSANAGTGKTHVLTQRVLRLLLTGTSPERILCLTYTKAAAAEMSKRVFDTLAGWVGMTDARLTTELTRLIEKPPAINELHLARTLFTRAIETPGGFKVQTIHAFCERLLQRFPLEAGVAPGFAILDDATGRKLIADAINDTLMEATGDREAPLGRALTTMVAYAADDQFDAVLGEAIRERTLLDALVRSPSDDDADPMAAASDLLHDAFAVRPGVDSETIHADMANVIDDDTLLLLAGALSSGSKTDLDAAQRARAAATASGRQRVDALATLFLTAESTPRKNMMTKALREAHPGLDALALNAQDRFHTLDAELRAVDVIEATLALYRLASAVLQRYRDAKVARAALDFDDLITRSASLLSSPEGAAWVLYKLDGGLDHILVDEAQDTSPAQWKVVEGIAAEFFADRGAGSKAGTRTVFAVGDEKQSIYSFQGAAPEMFAAMGERFKSRAEGVGMPWRAASLTLSFRTVEPILAAVDEVFADPVRTPGLLAETSSAIRHAAKRLGHGGLVEIWPTEKPDDKVETDAWSPLEETTPSSPVTRLATRIADTISGWLDTGEILASEGRPIRAGDIIVLVRKREPFASAIVAALKNAKVPVAGADRIALSRQIGVQDLIALGDFLTLPEDDLSLATVLKSPLFGFDDDDLLRLAHGRKGTLWKALLDAGPGLAKFGAACDLLKRWRKEADFMPPFEFYAAVLDHDGGRTKLLERLGPEAADSIDELLNLALTYDDQAPPSMTGFLASLREADHTIKRDMEQGRDEVRVLTVHGAKGLEAPIVFLPDTCSTRSARSAGGLLALDAIARPDGMPPLIVWPVKGASVLAPIQAAKEAREAKETEERNRLLYVALTRPRDRLYIAGCQSSDTLPTGCWYDVIARALAPHLTAVTLADGLKVRRIEQAQTVAAESRKGHLASDDAAAPRPAWMTAPAPREAQPAIPVAPSQLAPYDFDATGEPLAHAPAVIVAAAAPAEPVTTSPAVGGPNRFLRGTLTHALLQHLPTLPAADWSKVAAAYLERRGAELPASVRRSIVEETRAVLCDATFAPLFGPASQAEVPLVAELANPSGKGPALRLHGQIDRLVETPEAVLIIDYKTNRDAPADVAGVAEAYIVQLAAYKLALAAIFPGKPVRAALLWTQTARLMEIPTVTLEAYGARLWDLGTPKR